MAQGEILSRLLSEISDEYDKTVGSFFYDVEKPVSTELEAVYESVGSILKNGFAKTAEGKYLDNKVLEQGLTRKPATASTVVVKVTGSPNSSVSVGDKVASDELIFTIIENATIDAGGFVYVTASCDTPGRIGNIPVGAINRFPVTLSGLVTVTNEEAATGGYDEETDDELRERYFEKVSLPATSGSKHHYVGWAKEVEGVGDAKCIPLWNGNGTVKVIIINSDKEAASAELIAAVASHIEENRPIQYHDVVIPETLDNDGNVISKEHIERQPVLNPEWNPETEYIPRKDRPEWGMVGVLGKLVVFDDGTLQAGDACRCGDNGIAVKSVNNGYPVLKRISADKVLIWFRG